MNNLNYLRILKDNRKLVVVVVCVVVFVGLLITVFQPFKYRSTVQTLVIENRDDLDAYSAIRSAEKINNSLAHIIYTGSFRDQVLRLDFNKASIFPSDPAKRKAAWEKAIKAYPVADTGILKIDVYHTDREGAEILAKNVASILSSNGSDYVGSSQILIRIVDQPITSNYPVKPNIALNLITSVALGLLLSLGYVLLAYREEEEREGMDRLDEELGEAVEIPVTELDEQEGSEVYIPGGESNEQVEAVPVISQDKMEAVPVAVEATGDEGVYGAKAENEAEENSSAFYKILFPEKD